MSAHASARDLSLLIDRSLDGERRQWIQEHLADCDVCRERYQSTKRLVEHLGSLERAAPPSTLGMVVEKHRMEVGNSRLRRRLERNWKRLPDVTVLVYLAVVLALGAMTVILTRSGEDRAGTVIYAPSAASSPDSRVWVEPGVDAAAADRARNATEEEARRILARLPSSLPEGTQTVVARDGDAVIRVSLREVDAAAGQSSPSVE